MFDSLISAIEGLWSKLLQGLQATFDWLKPSLVWFVACGVAAIGIIGSLVSYVNGVFGQLLSAIAGLVMPDTTLPAVASDWLAVANTFFPVEEMFAYIGALCTLWIACVVYRGIKSYLPTIS